MNKGLIVVLGATATGKTSLAIKLAQKFNAPILSADSRQVYKHFDIGTSKPNLTERQGISHYLIDIAEPNTTLTLAEYQGQAQKLIAEFHAQGITPILVGGTGLYIKSIVAGMQIPRVAPNYYLRSQLLELGQSQCHQILQQVDPRSKIHANDQARTIRALEVFYVTGKPLTEQQGEHPPTYPICQIGISSPPLEIYKKIVSDRIEHMLKQGWLEEIKFIQNQYGSGLPLLSTLGYKEMGTYLSGQINLELAKELTVKHTLQFAKHQRTWFNSKSYGEVNWINNPQNFDSSFNNIEDLLNFIHN
ncbi:tRNA isopentenyltransferase MiaA [Synechococcus sp. PCC 7502]|uniref:tRNA (adenosine(37)-N6)-dimethylallyltransferase MiaA n=1 Tax=Synechococcus sp. PCC 7502 TaxID=1173263 RepID=UPI00029FDF6B|nr:tRNA (adenosine(37)-N6)-dimethylallyltransferase MiaA [Synechococcus sp. PCC 7502]AFY72760.1 tRNA isopentenyltransferase MiaA [Synechococcus sp. PCC 7502]